MKRIVLSLSVLLLLLALPSPQPASAEVASLVADLNVGTGANASSNPQNFVLVGGRVVFFAKGLSWVTDGTPAGTQRLSLEATFLQGIGMIGGAYLWFGGGLDDGYGLWRTQGTPATTYALVADGIHQPGPSDDEDPIPYAVADGKLYFFADSLWVTDGTRRGTRALAPLPTSATVANVAYHRGRVFFTTAYFHHYGANAWELWVSDGMPGGTRLLLSGHAGGFCSTRGGMLFFSGGRLWRSDGTPGGTHPLLPELEPDLVVRGQLCTSAGKLYFTADTPDQDDVLWVSDGTEARTRALHSLDSDSPLLLLGSRIFFVATDQEHGRELWSTRGTSRTTALVADIFPGPSSAFLDDNPQLTAAGGRVFFFAEDHVHGREVWVTDGTKEGTRLTRDVCRGHCSAAEPIPYDGQELTAVQGRVFFLANDGVHGRELWVTDGTREGSRLTSDICPGSCDVSDLRPLGREVFFYARDPLRGVELWASDGSPAGTQRLSDFSVAEPPLTFGFRFAPELARLGHRIVTVGHDIRSGLEPWVFDRLGRGGQLLGDLLTGSAEPGSDPRDIAVLGDRAFFVASDGSSDAVWATQGSRETTVKLATFPSPANPFVRWIYALGDSAYLNLGDLWRSDGTPAGTVRLTDVASSGRRVSTAVVALGSKAVFGVTAQNQSTELWVSDGTAGGTHAVGLALPWRIHDLTAIGDELYFWGKDDQNGGPSGWEIWTADSSLADIRQLTDRPAAEAAGPLDGSTHFTRVGAYIFFLMPEPWSSLYSLWRTDGTREGTSRVHMPTVEGFEPQTGALIPYQGSLLVFTLTGGDLWLWKTDGTTQGTVLIRDFDPETWLHEVLEARGEILFLVVHHTEDYDYRLYRTDGTSAGTYSLVDFAGLGVRGVGGLTSVGSNLFFGAGARYDRFELWTSEGTPDTTRLFHDINPGEAGSAPWPPWPLVVAGTRLYFSADDGLHGRELWSIPLDAVDAPCRPSSTALCLLDGRFRAELFWHAGSGRRGDGYALPWSSESGAFWFYDYSNPEAVVKMIDGAGVNDRYWFFFGPLTDAHVALTVTDVTNGRTRRYPEFPGPLVAFADIDAIRRSARAAEPCVARATRLCLQGGRFGVELSWRDSLGKTHPAQAYMHSETAGYFSFFGPHWVEAAVKLLDGRLVNGHSWLFATGLTDLETTLTITDTATGEIRTSTSERKPWSLIDLNSFP